MNIEEALRWVDRNCYDEQVVQRLRSRKVARTLSNEVERLRLSVDHAEEQSKQLAELIEENNRLVNTVQRLHGALGAASKILRLRQALQMIADPNSFKNNGAPSELLRRYEEIAFAALKGAEC